jgi:hypothetical protein
VFANLEDGFTMHAFLASTVGVDGSLYPAMLLAPFHTNTELSLAAHDIQLRSVDDNNVTESTAFGYLSSEQPHIPAGFQLSGPLNVFGQQGEAQLRLSNARHIVSHDVALQFEIQVRVPRLEAGSCVVTGPNERFARTHSFFNLSTLEIIYIFLLQSTIVSAWQPKQSNSYPHAQQRVLRQQSLYSLGYSHCGMYHSRTNFNFWSLSVGSQCFTQSNRESQ